MTGGSRHTCCHVPDTQHHLGGLGVMGLFKPPPGLTETESYGFSPACFSFAGGQIAKGFGDVWLRATGLGGAGGSAPGPGTPSRQAPSPPGLRLPPEVGGQHHLSVPPS